MSTKILKLSCLIVLLILLTAYNSFAQEDYSRKWQKEGRVEMKKRVEGYYKQMANRNYFSALTYAYYAVVDMPLCFV